MSIRTLIFAVWLAGGFAGAMASEDAFADLQAFETRSSLSAGAGYAQNVLLGEAVEVDSPFAYLSLEALAHKPLMGEQYAWNSLLFGEVKSFQNVKEVPEHLIALLQTELEGYVGLVAKGRVGVRYLRLTQVFDATFDEAERVDFVVRAGEPELYAGYQTYWGNALVDLEVSASRMDFANLTSDYDSLAAEIEVESELSDALLWQSKLAGWDRSYSERLSRDLQGGEVSGQLLRTQQASFETGLRYTVPLASSEHDFDLSAGYRDRTDNGSGYFDRSRSLLEFAWKFEAAGVGVELNSEYGKYRYANQLGEDALAKASESWLWELELERRLADSWTMFLTLSSESETSNEAFASFDTSSALLGIRWR